MCGGGLTIVFHKRNMYKMLKKYTPPGPIPQKFCSLDHFFLAKFPRHFSLSMRGCSEPINKVSNKLNCGIYNSYRQVKTRKQRSSNGKVELDGFNLITNVLF